MIILLRDSHHSSLNSNQRRKENEMKHQAMMKFLLVHGIALKLIFAPNKQGTKELRNSKDQLY
jgi:hypothetical protein